MFLREYDGGMRFHEKSWHAALVVALFLQITSVSWSAQDAKAPAPSREKQPTPAGEPKTGHEYSGMYSFLEDGEFVQITVEDEGRVTGYVSRYGKGESDKGAFLDQYFRSGKLDGNKVSFATETVHGVWFDFSGTVERGEGKNPGDEAYFVLKGTLAENTSDAAKKVTTNSHSVLFKRFPEESGPKPEVRN
jgi:hypothetical protein